MLQNYDPDETNKQIMRKRSSSSSSRWQVWPQPKIQLPSLNHIYVLQLIDCESIYPSAAFDKLFFSCGQGLKTTPKLARKNSYSVDNVHGKVLNLPFDSQDKTCHNSQSQRRQLINLSLFFLNITFLFNDLVWSCAPPLHSTAFVVLP